MSTINAYPEIDLFSDRINPVLVKELRKILKGRLFVFAFLSVLTFGWGMALFLTIDNYHIIRWGNGGAMLFASFYMLLMFPLCFIVPLALYESMREEFQEQTFEMLSISLLTRQRIAYGKLQSALLHMLLYYSAIAPFACFCYLTGGLGIISLVFAFGMSGLISLGACLWAIMWGSITKRASLNIVGIFAVIVGGLIAFGISATVSQSLQMFEMSLTTLFSMFIGFLCVGYVALFFVMVTLGITFSQMDQVNRGIRPYSVHVKDDGTVRFILPEMEYYRASEPVLPPSQKEKTPENSEQQETENT